MMGVATLDGRAFRLDPESVSWNYTIKASKRYTLGGEVVQIFGTKIDDMAVSGKFASWEEQQNFLEWTRELAGRQAARGGQVPEPYRFLFPTKRWDFLVWLKGFSQPGSSRSVRLANDVIAPPWTLTLQIVEDNTGLKRVAQDDFIKRISQGLGWEQTRYNGFLHVTDVEDVLSGMTVQEYLSLGYYNDPTVMAELEAGP